MIDLYTWSTPNGRKVSILLEELGLPYRAIAVDITKGEQHAPDFLAISPNNRIPAIVDHDNGRSLMESGAIMLYLASKISDPALRLIPETEERYWDMMAWLMWQMGGLGPMLGQTHHFVKYNAGKSPYAEERYLTETRRLYGVLEQRLADRDWIAGSYSLADIAIWPWISRFEWQTMDLNEWPSIRRWYLTMAERPAVQRGYQVPQFVTEIPMP